MLTILPWFFSLVILQTQSSDPPSAWWERETQMDSGGKLLLNHKPWWERTAQLKTGEQFVVKSEFPGGGWMIIQKEKRSRGSDSMLVWMLDDDGDMDQNQPQGDADSDCYVVDYGCDGTVDRMVDRMDADGDQIPDEMDIRYFVNGELRRSWFGMDLDRDGKMWDLADYEYTGDFFRSDPYGNNMIYMNKYHPAKRAWVPISECPFAFYDTDGNGESDTVVRFSAAPLQFSPLTDSDYANSQDRYQGPYDPSMDQMGVMNVRYSFDIDGLNSKMTPLHYDMGFTMTGKLPYQFPGMNHFQSLRREPKVTVCAPYDQARTIAETYPADQTGFTWREFEDSGLRIGDPTNPDYDRRWEGVFWTWKRRPLHNTGGPVQDWNVRREFLSEPSHQRELYYSPIDRRFHLKGAKEGWMEIGRIINDQPLGEVRMFDTNHDGYFDRWEYYRASELSPYRIASISNAADRNFGNRWSEIRSFYTQQVLPEAIRLNESLIAAIASRGGEFAAAIPDNLAQALNQKISPDERRFILDIIREYRYLRFRQIVQERIQAGLEEPQKKEVRSVLSDLPSTQAWESAVWLAAIDADYEVGDYQAVVKKLTQKPIISEADQEYIQRFQKHFTEVSPLPDLAKYATPARYDELYMKEPWDAALKNVNNNAGGIAWGWAYRMMSLNEMFLATGDRRYLEANLLCTRAVLAARDDVRGVTLWNGKIAPAWSSDKYAERGRAVFAVHTGMIVYPILEFLLLSKQLPDANLLTSNEFQEILNKCEESLAYHDRQWRDGPDVVEGHYIGMDQENVLEGKPLPGNRLSSMGRALWYSWKLTGNREYYRRAGCIGEYIKNRLHAAADGAFYWSYWLPLLPVTKPDPKESIRSEDISHASLTAALPILLASEGLVFSREDLERMGNTVTQGFTRLNNGILFGDITGSPKSNPELVQGPGRWLRLSPWVPEVYERLALYFQKYQPTPGPLDLALLIRFAPKK